MIKQIVKTQTVAALSAAGTFETKIELGTEVKRVLGYYVQVLADGGLVSKSQKVSYANSSKTIFEPVSLGHLIVGENVAIKERFFKEEPFNVDGYVNSRITTNAAVGATAMEVQHIFLVETTA